MHEEESCALRLQGVDGLADLLDGRHARGDEHRLALAGDVPQHRQVGQLPRTRLEGRDPQLLQEVRRLRAERRSEVLDTDRLAVADELGVGFNW